MSAPDEVNRRLDAALTRLESAIETRLAAQESAAADAERTKLEQEMAAVRNECTHLKETSAAVSQRLDAAIGKIKGILDE